MPAPVEVVEASPTRPTEFDELELAKDVVLGVRLDSPVSSQTARVEDRVTARIARDVTIDHRVVVPSGSRLEGVVTVVERGGKFRERARVGVQFNTLILADNTRLSVETETIYRDGDAPGNKASSKIGASAVVGTILGAVIGGKKGAAIGSAAGAAGGTAAVMAGDVSEAVLPAGSPLTLRLTAPVTLVIPHEP